MPNIKLSAEQKKEILEALVKGSTVAEIAQSYGVATRTINRLIEKTRNVTFAEPNSEPPIPVRGAVNFNLDIPTSESLYLRLMGLSQAALNVTEEILLNPDSTDLSRLKAASLIGQWTGLLPSTTGNMSLCTKLKMMEIWQRDFEAGYKYKHDQPFY